MTILLRMLASGFVRFAQMLPLRVVARLGRYGGGLAYWLDARHRNMARANLAMSLGHEMTPEQIEGIARENFKRIGETFACALKTACMTDEELRPHLELGPDLFGEGERPSRVVVAIGHFGNFEMYARCGQLARGYQNATTYRGLAHPALDRVFQGLREKSGCRFFERRTEAAELRKFMNQEGVMLGLLSDQHAGNSGARIPFLGRECSTSTAAALMALRYGCTLLTGFCFRTGLAQWRLEGGARIETRVDGRARPIEDIMRDVNSAFEAAVRRDPANWFWVHNRWKDRRSKLGASAGNQRTAAELASAGAGTAVGR